VSHLLNVTARLVVDLAPQLLLLLRPLRLHLCVQRRPGRPACRASRSGSCAGSVASSMYRRGPLGGTAATPAAAAAAAPPLLQPATARRSA
jgi:hypothetical protein